MPAFAGILLVAVRCAIRLTASSTRGKPVPGEGEIYYACEYYSQCRDYFIPESEYHPDRPSNCRTHRRPMTTPVMLVRGHWVPAGPPPGGR